MRHRGEGRSFTGRTDAWVGILLAVARGGATTGAVLQCTTAAALESALRPVLASDGVLVSEAGAAYPGCARTVGLQHERVNQSAGHRVRGSYHLQAVNNRHSQFNLFLLPFRGVATKYLESYLHSFQQVDRASQPSARACLVAASSEPRMRFAN